MRAASWFKVDRPEPDGSRWVSETHVFDGVRHDYRWLCDRRIDPKKEVDRRALELLAQAKGRKTGGAQARE